MSIMSITYESLYIVSSTVSDESAMKQVVPQPFQDNTELYEKVVEVSSRAQLYT